MLVKVKVKGKAKGKVRGDQEDKDDKYDKGGLPFEAHYFLRCLLHNRLIDIYSPKMMSLMSCLYVLIKVTLRNIAFGFLNM